MLLIGKKERGLNMPNQEELEKYVETLVLMTTSIQRLNWNEDHHSIENIDLLSKKIEETLMGRVLLLPPYFYLSEQSEKSKEQIADIVQAYREQGFQYICILTDLDFTVEDEDEGESIENLKFLRSTNLRNSKRTWINS